MPRPAPEPVIRAGIVPPEEAIAVFNRRDLLLPSFNWHDVWQQEHLRGFASSGVMRYDILQLLRDEVGVAIERGRGGDAFVKAVKQRLVDAGFWGEVEVTHPVTGEQRTTRFNDSRLRLIHDVNLGQSYMAGKAERYQRTKRYLPYLRYLTKRDERVRVSHRPWHGVVLPVDDPWWDLHHPRKAWRCRCDVAALSERQVAALQAAGLPVQRTPPVDPMVDAVDVRTGDTIRLPEGVDPAFAYHPGKRPLAGAVPRQLLADPYDRTPSLQPAPAMPTPRRAPRRDLLPPGTPPEEAARAFLAEFGAVDEPQVFTDVLGSPLVISDELFRTMDGRLEAGKRGREQWMRLLARAVREPDEIWASWEHHHAKDADVLRRRYLARFLVAREVDAVPVPATAVFEVGKDGWLGITAYQAENADAVDSVLRSVRRGVRLYVRAGTEQAPLPPAPAK